MTSATYSNQENKEQKSTSEFLEKVNQTKAITLQDNRPSSFLQKKQTIQDCPIT